MFVARFVAAAFWLRTDFCCCSKLRNKSPQQKSMCVIGFMTTVKSTTGDAVTREARREATDLVDTRPSPAAAAVMQFVTAV